MSPPSHPARTAATRPLSLPRLVLLSPHLLGWATACAIASAVLSLAPFWGLYRLTPTLLASSPDLAEVWRVLGWLLALLALRWALMAGSHMLAHAGTFRIQYRLRLDMARHLGVVPLSCLTRQGSGRLRRLMNEDVNSLEGFFAHTLPDAVTAATVPLATLAVLFCMDWRMALATLAPVAPALAAQAWFMRHGDRGARQWAALQADIANQAGEYVRGIHVVKSFNLDARSFGRLADAIHHAVDWVQAYAGQRADGWVLFVSLLTSSLVIVAPLGAWLHYAGRLDLPTYVLFLLLAPAALAPLLRLTYALGDLPRHRDTLGRISALLATPPLAGAANARPQAPDRAATQPPDIVFSALRHRYGERLALDDVSFQARAGQLTALVGASGSGKSTLVQLVARLHEFESGALRVGGRDVRDWPPDALMAQLGIVFQEVVLFSGSVRDNLLLARPQASPAQLEAAARAACAHDFIVALPQGYDTPLGEHGARLSGGERQRLSIARALLKDAPILLLDEATASVDAENEALIQQALQTLCQGRTVLMIAHRLRTIQHADHIVVMHEGRVAGQGRHAALLQDCPPYRRLWHDHEQALHWSLPARRVKKEQP